ncbi:ATP-binding protein [Synechococcus lacustris C3-12m-Tous]|nr:ATP-binding protein [Synechococcus lacustris]MCP9795923.1 ATP-binding protein [Synechococcus lacustris L1F-Slac]MCP9925605.1 ATP-binding protein [Synechococcus lacustris C3-12m-Tous]
MDSWDELINFISTETDQYISDKKKSYGLKLAAEEIISNIVRISEDKEGVIIKIKSQKVTSAKGKLAFELVIADNGVYFNPEFDSLENPSPKIKISERKEGGLGLFLAKVSCDSVKYIYKDFFNIYTLSINMEEIHDKLG